MKNQYENFIDQLAQTTVSPLATNQYSYLYEENDIRRQNLLLYLQQMGKKSPQIMLVGEAPGYRGSRLTGVPFTSPYLLMNNIQGLDFFGKDKGYQLTSENNKLLKEATATIIWNTLLENKLFALGWNAFPFHPHQKENEKSNRTPLQAELQVGEEPLLQMIEMFSIKKVVAVGNKAEKSLNKLGIENQKVRHPAQGGRNEFAQGIKEIKEKLRKE